MLESEVLAQQAATNSKEQFALGDFHDVMMDAVIEGLGNYQSMADQVLNNEQVLAWDATLLSSTQPYLSVRNFIVRRQQRCSI